jgi:hypothetical protein
MTCPWYARWWHRRLRATDRAVMLPALWDDTAIACPDRSPEEQQKIVAIAWRSFTFQPGQDHWHCPCAGDERRKAVGL